MSASVIRWGQYLKKKKKKKRGSDQRTCQSTERVIHVEQHAVEILEACTGACLCWLKTPLRRHMPLHTTSVALSITGGLIRGV